MKALPWIVAAALCLPALPSPLAAQQVVDCGTDSSQRVLCAAGGKVESAKLVRDLSSNRCGPAGTWGWTGNAVWTDNGCRGQFAVTLAGAGAGAAAGAGAGADSARGRVSCGTLTSRRQECPAGGVVDSISRVEEGMFARCRPGSNYGFRDSVVWAGNGCRAEFEVVYRRASTGVPQPGPARPVTRTITCGDPQGQLQTCRTDGQVDTVRLVRDLGRVRCQQDVNWDYARSLVWTRNGCRGQFEVTYRETLGTAPDTATAASTRRITCGNYTTAQVTCPTQGYATDVRLVRDYTGNRCKEGSTWGHTVSSIWTNRGCRGDFDVTYRDTTTAGTRRLSCGTNADTQVRCEVGAPVTKVRVVRNLGTSLCRQGVNYKAVDRAILAGRGCRAEFEVTLGREGAPGMQPVTPATRVVSCGNASGAAMSCNAFGTVATVRLERDRSNGRCAQSSSWGLNDQAIWVSKGCYGDFALTYARTDLK